MSKTFPNKQTNELNKGKTKVSLLVEFDPVRPGLESSTGNRPKEGGDIPCVDIES